MSASGKERYEHSLDVPIAKGAIPACKLTKTKAVLRQIKIAVLFIFMLISTVIFATNTDLTYDWHQLSVSRNQKSNLTLYDTTEHRLPVLHVYVRADFSQAYPSWFTNNLTITVTNTGSNDSQAIQVFKAAVGGPGVESLKLYKVDFSGQSMDNITLIVESTTGYSTPVNLAYTFLSTNVNNSVIYAAVILISVYVLIIFELIHRTMAAMLGAMSALATLAALNQKPTMAMVLGWLDYETLMLLFGMMLLVAIFCETGFFDWAALMAYKLAKGREWPLITIICLFSCVVSAFLDNVTTILLMTPVTIRLCEVLELDPKHVLIAEVMFSNIGGTATGIGDPPNVIIVSNEEMVRQGVTFTTFTLHMALGTVFVAVAAYAVLRVIYRNKELLKSNDTPELAELKHEIEVWRRASLGIVVATREESMVKALLMQKVVTLENLCQRKMYDFKRNNSIKDFQTHVNEMESKYVIQDKWLLVKSSVVLGVVIIAFFTNSFISEFHLTIGWIAIIGAMWLLVLSDYTDLEGVLHRIEWATLLFFAALFVLMKAIEMLGLIGWIADQVTLLIRQIDEDSRLAVSIIIIIWVSALVSSFIDNIPFTTAMVPVILQLAGDKSINLPLGPLVWALAFGACLGGNGTIIGASANVVCAGIADTHGHHGFSFWDFFKVGFPMMLVTVCIAMCYLLICHVALDWHI